MKTVVGQVTEEEKIEIQKLFERRNGLNELATIITTDNEELYEKLVADIGKTSVLFDSWWQRMAEKYRWKSSETGHWEIDFSTNEIYLCD